MLLFYLTFCNVRPHLFEDSEIIIFIFYCFFSRVSSSSYDLHVIKWLIILAPVDHEFCSYCSFYSVLAALIYDQQQWPGRGERGV